MSNFAYYVVVVRPKGKYKNIGDYIQSIAARQFYPRIDGYVDREDLYNLQAENNKPIKIIMNGCYLMYPEKWPPSNNIIPLFVSTHFFPFKIEKILEKKEYLGKHSPIGCRDSGTMNYLRNEGVECYFSGCLTLTLGNIYHYNEGKKRKEILFVDPTFPILKRNQITFEMFLKLSIFFLTNIKKCCYFAKKDFFRDYGNSNGRDFRPKGIKGILRRIYKATSFYITYRTKFDDDILFSAEFLMHELSVDEYNSPSDEGWCNIADSYLKKYMTAELVVTSRIHAALPCLALKTPVIFVNSDIVDSQSISFNTPGRFGGIIDLFRNMYVNKFEIFTKDEKLRLFKRINKKTKFENKDDWEMYAIDLNNRCKYFVK